MEHLAAPALPVFLLVACVIGLGVSLLAAARIVRRGRVAQTPYESGVDPIHDTRRRFDVRFHLLAIAFLVFDVELLFLYPWAVTAGNGRGIGMGTSVPIGVDARQAALEQGHEASDKVRATSQQPPAALQGSPTSNAKPAAPLSPVQRSRQSRASESASANSHVMFTGAMVFVILLTLGYVYDWRKGVFRWR
jgi:NADH:ubiquinone oxidoreductase subunit 3 (subunit A)